MLIEKQNIDFNPCWETIRLERKNFWYKRGDLTRRDPLYVIQWLLLLRKTYKCESILTEALILTTLDLDFCVFCSYLSWIWFPITSLKILQVDWLNSCDHDTLNFQYGIYWDLICNDWNDWHMFLSSTAVIIGLSHTQ